MKKILTIILDGFGYREEEKGNAIKAANMTFFNSLWQKYPHLCLEASEEAVGLAKGQAGNSEVGHMTIGAGRLLKQNEILVNEILEEPPTDNKNYNTLLSMRDKDVHIMGLCSDGNIHAGVDDFLSMYNNLVHSGFTKIHFHVITDGRDTGVHDAMKYIDMLNEAINQTGIGDIATICGRYYAMDRDENYDRTKKYYNLVVGGIGQKFNSSFDAINYYYNNDITDEFMEPIRLNDIMIKDGDVLVWMNYRADRAKQILDAFVNFKTFEKFRVLPMDNLSVFSFFTVDKRIKTLNLIEHPEVKNCLGLYLSELDFTQARIAESEKFPHVTYFFDGGVSGKIKGCDKFHIPSPSVATYDLKPEMSAYEVTDNLIKVIEEKSCDVIIVNYANGDMVGHTGNLEKTIEAVEALDKCVGRVISKIEEVGGEALITADHGNCEQMLDLKTGEPITSHSTFDVPLIVVSDRVKSVKSGRLCDLTPTLLKMMGEEIPSEMTGEPLVELD